MSEEEKEEKNEEKEEKEEEKEEEKDENKENKKEKKKNKKEGKEKKKTKKDKKEKEKKKKETKNLKDKIKKEDQIQKNELNMPKENKAELISTPTNLAENKNNLYNTPSPFEMPIQSSLQILSNINNEMDLLSNKIQKDFTTISTSSVGKLELDYPPILPINNNNYVYDKEDFEIKELLIKANHLINISKNNNKLNNKLNNNDNIKKYENKIIQSDEPNFKYSENNNNINKDIKNNYDLFDRENMNNNHTNQKDIIDINKYLDNNDEEVDDMSQKYFINRKPKVKNIKNNNYKIRDYLNLNVNDKQNNFDNENIHKYQDFSSQKNEINSRNNSLINRTKKIEDLYKYTNNPRRIPMVYSQPPQFQ